MTKLSELAGGSGVTTFTSVNDLPLTHSAGDMAFVDSSDRLYVSNGNGWYSVSIVNATPTITSVLDSDNAAGPFTLSTDGANTVITVTASDSDGTPITYSATADSDFGGLATFTQSSNVFTVSPLSEDSATTSSGTITFKASDGIGLGTSQQTFTLEFNIVNSNYTTLLLSTDGSAGDNNDITDASSNSHTVTVNGDAHATTFSPYRHGGYSTHFSYGSYLQAADSNDWNLGSNDFTVEFWTYIEAFDSGVFHAVGHWTGSSGRNWVVYLTPTVINFSYSTTGSNFINNEKSHTFNTHTWYHVALVRNGDTLTYYVDGTSIGTLDLSSITFINGTGVFNIGANNSGGYGRLTGYMKDVRFVVGTAVYTSAFDPPTESLTAITNTKLLICNTPYIKDVSSSGHSFSINNTIEVLPFSPYDHNGYDEADHGGSISFDGTGDYFTVADSTDFDLTSTSSWTLEGWAYRENNTTDQYLVSQGVQSVNGNYISNINLQKYNSGVEVNALMIQVYHSNNKIVLTTPANSVGVKKWHHIAVQYSSSSGWSAYIDGKSQTLTALSGQSEAASSTNWGWTNSSLPSGPLYFGARSYTNGGDYHLNGHMADWKWTASIQYTSDFTPPTSPSSSTNALFHIKGTDAHIIDKSQSAKAVKLLGNATASTTETKYASASMYFDGTGDYIETTGVQIPTSATASWTLEAWVYATFSDDNIERQIFSQYVLGSSSRFLFGYHSGEYRLFNGGTSVTSSTGTWANNTWHHVAATYNGSACTLWVNGNSQGSMTINRGAADHDLNIGGRDATNYWQGYIEDARLSLGLVRYTSNFTPPTSLQG